MGRLDRPRVPRQYDFDVGVAAGEIESGVSVSWRLRRTLGREAVASPAACAERPQRRPSEVRSPCGSYRVLTRSSPRIGTWRQVRLPWRPWPYQSPHSCTSRCERQTAPFKLRGSGTPPCCRPPPRGGRLPSKRCSSPGDGCGQVHLPWRGIERRVPGWARTEPRPGRRPEGTTRRPKRGVSQQSRGG
jgi:hypothetical protein